MLSPNSFSTRARKLLTSGLFLMVFASCFGILLTLAYASLGSSRQDQFLTLSTLGGNMSTSGYYPAVEGLFVSEGESMNWNVQVYNHMGEPEYVAVRIKLLNATQNGPDDVLLLPSPAAYIYEEKQVIADGATWKMPLSISIKDIDNNNGDSAIRSLNINGKEIVNLNITNNDDTNFRFIIELWRYDANSKDFLYTWPSGPETETAWNQIWIRVR
jgi:hypothetical protein